MSEEIGIQVRVIEKHGKAALVEWEGLHRTLVPTDALEGMGGGMAMVCPAVLDAGVPWGAPWGEVSFEGAAERFERELHRLGIWTGEDARAKPSRVLTALQAACSDALRAVFTQPVAEPARPVAERAKRKKIQEVTNGE